MYTATAHHEGGQHDGTFETEEGALQWGANELCFGATSVDIWFDGVYQGALETETV
jgi:hypothetical protein